MGTVPILDFRGLPQSRAQGHAEVGPPPPLQGGRLGPTMTDITERGFLYLAVHNSQKTYI